MPMVTRCKTSLWLLFKPPFIPMFLHTADFFAVPRNEFASNERQVTADSGNKTIELQ